MCVKYFVDIFNEVFTWCHQTIAAPTLLTAQFVAPNVELAWVDNATNDECWMIWRSTDGTNFTLIETVNVENLEDYTDTTAAAGVLYYYKVQACNLDGDTSDFSNIVQVTNTMTPVKYGMLYNWYAVDDARGMAPVGWHIPTGVEQGALMHFIDPSGTYNNNTAGGHLKEVSIYWDAPNTGATDTYGFHFRGNGQRIGGSGNFATLRTTGTLWSSTVFLGTLAKASLTFRTDAIFYTNYGLFSTDQPKASGFGIRWIKDDAVNPGTVADYDGNIYGCVTIGTQVWTDRNAVVTHYNNGDEIPYEDNAADWAALVTGARCLYNNSYAYL